MIQGRPHIDRIKLVEEYGAKVFDGPTAQSLGYIDVANSNYESALTELMIQANIDPTKTYQVVELQPKCNFWAAAMKGDFSLLHGKLDHYIHWNSDQTAFIKDQFAYLYRKNG